MNKEDKKEVHRKMQFLVDAAFQLSKTSPNLSQFYISKLDETSFVEGTKIVPSIKRRFCNYCFSLFKPQVNCSVRVKGIKKLSISEHRNLQISLSEDLNQELNTGTIAEATVKREKFKQSKVKNAVVIHCKVCTKINVFGGTKKGAIKTLQKVPTLKETDKSSVELQPKGSTLQTQPPKQSKSQKVKTLKALVNQNKKKEEAKSNLFIGLPSL